MATNNSINSNDPIQVALGGTGNSTLTAHGVLVGEGTSTVTVLSVGTNGQTLIGATSADPAFATLTSTAGSVTYTTGANSLNLDVANYSNKTSFTPALQFGGGSTGLTYSTQAGFYERAGSLIVFQIYLVLSAVGSSTGTATVAMSGLPTSITNNAVKFITQNVTFSNTISAYISTSSNTINLVTFASGGTGLTNLSNTGFGNSSVLYLSGCYIT